MSRSPASAPPTSPGAPSAPSTPARPEGNEGPPVGTGTPLPKQHMPPSSGQAGGKKG